MLTSVKSIDNRPAQACYSTAPEIARAVNRSGVDGVA